MGHPKSPNGKIDIEALEKGLGKPVNPQVKAVLIKRNQAAAALTGKKLNDVYAMGVMGPIAEVFQGTAAKDNTLNHKLVRLDIETVAHLARMGGSTNEKSVTVDISSLDQKTGKPKTTHRVIVKFAAHDDMSTEVCPLDDQGQTQDEDKLWLLVTQSQHYNPDGVLRTGVGKDGESTPKTAIELANYLREAVKQQARLVSA